MSQRFLRVAFVSAWSFLLMRQLPHRSSHGLGFCSVCSTSRNVWLARKALLSHAQASTDRKMNRESIVSLTYQEMDTDDWGSYRSTMNDIMSHGRVVRTLNDSQAQPVREYLLSNEQWIRLSPDLVSLPLCNAERGTIMTSSSFRETLKLQRFEFLAQTNFTHHQYEYLARCITYLGDHCASSQTPRPLLPAWSKLLEVGLIPQENCISTYLYVLSLDQKFSDISLSVATYHDLMYEPNEKTITLRIKSLIARRDAMAAESLLASLPDKGKSAQFKRLRTFSPLLAYYRDNGDVSSVLRIVRQMRSSNGVIMDTETYTTALSTLALAGSFRVGAASIPGAIELGYPAASGPILWDSLAAEMAEDILELTEQDAHEVARALIAGFSLQTTLNMTQIPRVVNSPNLLHVGRVTVNELTSVCPETGSRMQLFALTNDQRQRVHETLLDMARAQHEEYGERLKQQGKLRADSDGQFAYDRLLAFSAWLKERDGPPFTAIIDGPNVAFYGHGDLHYSQVEMVVNELERLGENPLVVMPLKYTQESFFLSSLGFKQQLNVQDILIRDNLTRAGKMYVVPTGCLDDYYWMLASVASQHIELTEVKEQRLPGLRPLIVTNDQMRDHRLALLESRLFRRWTSCHIMNYNLEPYTTNEWENRSVHFTAADVFSREIQGNVAADGKTMAWHIPITEWTDPDRFFIHLEQ